MLVRTNADFPCLRTPVKRRYFSIIFHMTRRPEHFFKAATNDFSRQFSTYQLVLSNIPIDPPHFQNEAINMARRETDNNLYLSRAFLIILANSTGKMTPEGVEPSIF